MPKRLSIVARAKCYAARFDPAISESGGHDATFAAACAVCHGFDISAEETFAVLNSGYNQSCLPPWSEAELKRKCSHAFAKKSDSRKPVGWLLKNDDYAAGIEAEPELREGTAADIGTVARLRKIPSHHLAHCQRIGLLRFGQRRGERAWAVTDSSRRLIEFRRMDGKPWPHGGKSDTWGKTRGKDGKHLLGLPLVGTCRKLFFVEGAPNLLAGVAYICANDWATEFGIVAMTGASKWMLPEETRELARHARHVRIVSDNDAAGERGASKWAAQLWKAGVGFDAFDWDAAGMPEGSDLNDYVTRELWKEAS